MSPTTLPRLLGQISGYCWAAHPDTQVHCTEPAGHPTRGALGGHWHPYTRTSW